MNVLPIVIGVFLLGVGLSNIWLIRSDERLARSFGTALLVRWFGLRTSRLILSVIATFVALFGLLCVALGVLGYR